MGDVDVLIIARDPATSSGLCEARTIEARTTGRVIARDKSAFTRSWGGRR